MATAVKHRHSTEGGYQRGEETRARIVAAAMKIFGERGYDGASTREIAASAGVNPPALQYYFDSKQGVYIACVEYMISRVWEYMSEVVSRAEQLLQQDADDDQLIDAYCAIQVQLAEFTFTVKDADEWRLFMAQQQAGGGPISGFEIWYRNINRRMTGIYTGLLSRLLGCPMDAEETLVRVAAIGGQLAVFHLARRNVLTALNWDSVNSQRLVLVKRIVREHTEILLRSMVAKRRAAGDSRGTRAKTARASKSKKS